MKPIETKDPSSENIVYYYSREKRLAKAPESVKNLASMYGKKRPGFFKTMTATKPLKFLFFTIIILSLASLIITVTNKMSYSGNINGNKMTVKAMWYDGTVYTTIKRTLGSKSTKAISLELDLIIDKQYKTVQMPLIENECKISMDCKEKPKTIVVVCRSIDGKNLKLEAYVD